MNTLEIYEGAEDLLQNRITLEARQDKGSWIRVPVMFASSMDEDAHISGGSEGWAVLSISKPTEFRATFPDPVLKCCIRPSMQVGLDFETDGSSVIFKVESPKYLMLNINGNECTERTWPGFSLYILVDKIDHNIPDKNSLKTKILFPGHHMPEEFIPDGHDTIFLQPGIHTVEGQMLELHSNTILYLSGGAYLRSYIRGENVSNSSIRGRGVIDGTGVNCKSREWRDDGDAGFIFFRRGMNNTIDGPVIFDAPHWNIVTFGTQGTVIRNHKCITWKVNNDGIQPRSCNDMLVEHCFFKCADDCIAVKTRRTAGLTSSNLVFRDIVCWNDTPGNAIEIGHTSQADLLENVLFEDIYVIHSVDKGPKTQYVVSISLIDHCTVKNVKYRNIFVEGKSSGDFRFWIGSSRYTTDNIKGRIDGIIVDGYHKEGNFTYTTFSGTDKDHSVNNVNMKNITCNNGRKASFEDLKANISHAYGLKFS